MAGCVKLVFIAANQLICALSSLTASLGGLHLKTRPCPCQQYDNIYLMENDLKAFLYLLIKNFAKGQLKWITH